MMNVIDIIIELI